MTPLDAASILYTMLIRLSSRRARHNVQGSNGVLNATGLTISVRAGYLDFLYEISAPTTSPCSKPQWLDVIPRLMFLLTQNATTAYATHIPPFHSIVTHLLTGSHTAVQIVTPPQVPEHAKVMSCELCGSKSSA